MPPRLALLLHMHQPDYRDPDSGAPQMPWVRLHACRGYTDVPVLAAEHGARPTINVVPSLLRQLAAYRDGATDRWEELSRVRAEDLDDEQRDFIRQRFVHGHPRLREASPRYAELAARAQALSAPAELRDLQVWSNLAWMGVVARRDPFVADLVRRDRDFDHAELLALLDRQRQLVAGVLDLWSQAASLSCSPLCHPILPLLVDFRHARRSLPELPRDLGAAGRFRWPDDALRHLLDARRVTEELLGRTPQGLWPSEGSVSPEVAELVAAAGYAWMATDEGVLARSAVEGRRRLDAPWVLDGQQTGLRLLFRDRDLSDRIGFHYQQWRGADAAADLLAAAGARWGQDAVVPVILDGENPWESYPEAGREFLDALFDSGAIVDFDALAQCPPAGRVTRLHTGSWIGADLRIWAGDEEDRTAWGLLADLRQAWEDAGRPEAAWEALSNAESSDWFWWFGPEFETPVADLFDALFRAHLAAAWRACGLEPPRRLRAPISRHVQPRGPLVVVRRADPTFNAHLHLAEWAHAAPLPVPQGGAMAEGSRWLRGGAAGFGAHHLWLRLDLPYPEPSPPIHLLIDDGRRFDLWSPAAPLQVHLVEGCLVARLPWTADRARFALVQPPAEPGLQPRRHPAEGWLELALVPRSGEA